MISDKKVLCIIPARKGSKGLINKNIKIFNKKPLIYWTINEANKSKYIDRCIVSTDCTNIQKIAINCGAEAPFLRPKEISGDNASIYDAISFTLKKIRDKFDIIILLQPTSPLRTFKDINKCFEMMVKQEASSIVSITKLPYPYEWILKKDKNKKIKFISKKYISLRQKTKNYYKSNGAIFISTIQKFNKNKKFYTNDTCGYEMPIDKSIDIDSLLDFKIAEFLYKKNK